MLSPARHSWLHWSRRHPGLDTALDTSPAAETWNGCYLLGQSCGSSHFHGQKNALLSTSLPQLARCVGIVAASSLDHSAAQGLDPELNATPLHHKTMSPPFYRFSRPAPEQSAAAALCHVESMEGLGQAVPRACTRIEKAL